MASGSVSYGLSGAAQGAATGAVVGGVPGAVIGGVIGGIGGFITGSSSDSQFANQQAWRNYNAQQQYNVDLYNIHSSLQLAGMNAAMMQGMAGVQNAAIAANVAYNIGLITSTTLYNNSLMEQELSEVWQDYDLDIVQLEAARARERGGIVARQAASGTVIGTGSNKEVVIDQMTQEALDANVVLHGAQRQAAKIQNEMSQSSWQGQLAIQQTAWEGEVQSWVNSANANIQGGGSLATAKIQANAATYGAELRKYNAQMGMVQAAEAYDLNMQNQLISGLFQAGSTAAVGYYNTKVPSLKKPGGSVPTYLNPNTAGQVNNANLAYANAYSTTPGTSLMVS